MSFSEAAAERASKKWKAGGPTYIRTFENAHETVDMKSLATQRGKKSTKLLNLFWTTLKSNLFRNFLLNSWQHCRHQVNNDTKRKTNASHVNFEELQFQSQKYKI